MPTAKNKVDIFVKAHDKASKQLKGISKILSRIPKPIKQIGVAYLSWQGATKLLQGTIGAAMRQEETMNRLANSIKLAGKSYEDAEPKLNAYFNRMQETTRYGDTDMARVIKDLTVLTGEFGDATLDAGEIAADMAASGLFNLETATRFVGMAMGGNVEMLGRYIPEMKASAGLIDKNMTASQKWAIAQDVLKKKFGGLAAGELNTFAGRLNQLNNYWGDFGEAIGDIVLPALTAIVKALVPVAKSLASFMQFFGSDQLTNSANDMRKLADAMLDIAGSAEMMADIETATKEYKETVAELIGQIEAQDEAQKKVYTNLADAFAEAEPGYLGVTHLQETLNDKAEEYKETIAAIREAHAAKTEGIKDDIKKETVTSLDAMAIIRENALALMDFQKELEEERIQARQEAVDFLLMTEDEVQDYLTNRRRDTMIESKNYTVQEVADYVKAQNKKKAAYNVFAGIISDTAQALADDMVEQMWGAQSNFRDIFKQMAKDFVKYFIGEITKAIALAVIKWVSTLIFFDKRENDLRAMQSGVDFARFFTEGANKTFGRIDPMNLIPGMRGGSIVAPMAGQAGGGGRSITVNVNVETMIGTQDFIDQVIVPGVERAIRRDESNIVIAD